MCALAKQSPFVVRDRRAVDFTRDGEAAHECRSNLFEQLPRERSFQVRSRSLDRHWAEIVGTVQASSAAGFEFSSVCDPRAHGQETMKVGGGSSLAMQGLPLASVFWWQKWLESVRRKPGK
jgi:hypothetical protein